MTMSLTEASVFDNLTWFDRLCRKFALDFISQLQHGDITVVEGNQRLRFGDEQAELKTVITVLDPAFYQKMVMAGSVGGGEAYIHGWWRCDNLTALVRIFALNLAIGFVLGPKSPLAFSMYADTADYNEWRTGRRATAMTFAAATFSQKLGGALASAMIGWLLAATQLGFIAGTLGFALTGAADRFAATQVFMVSSVLGALAWLQAGSAIGYGVQVEAGAVLKPGEAR